MIPGVERRPDTEAELEAFETAFRREGLPMLIEDYSPAYDIFTRAVPLLGLVLLLEVLAPPSSSRPRSASWSGCSCC